MAVASTVLITLLVMVIAQIWGMTNVDKIARTALWIEFASICLGIFYFLTSPTPPKQEQSREG